MPAFFQWTLPAKSGKTEDHVINTFTFEGTFSEAMVTAAVIKILAFYNNDAPATGSAVGEWIGASISRTQPMSFKVWNVTGSTTQLGEPDGQDETVVLVGSATAASLPRECSVALSFSAPASSGLIPRRRRGRIYIGPLVSAASNEGVASATGRVQVVDACQETLVSSAAEYLGDPTVPAALHAVWSRAGNAIVGVNRYWCDDAFDTQRRRGEDPASIVENFV